jgi:hypothetical protein
MLSALRPHRGRVLLLGILLLLEIALGALQPWPLKVVIDNVLQGKPFPPAIQPWVDSVIGGRSLVLLVAVVISGVMSTAWMSIRTRSRTW